MAPIATAEITPLRPAISHSNSSFHKRDHASIDDDADSILTSPTSPLKRKKVSWSDPPESEIRLIDEFGGKSVALLREEIRQAVVKHKEGSDGAYNRLLRVFRGEADSEDTPSNHLFQKYLLSLRALVHILDKDCTELVNSVLDLPWLDGDDALVYQYSRFTVSLVVVQSGYLRNAFHSIAARFSRPFIARFNLPNVDYISAQQRQDRLHSLLQSILRARPDASGSIINVFAQKYPFLADSDKVHVRYARNLLRVIETAEELRSPVLELIIERMVRIDVSVQIDIQDFTEEFVENIIEEHFEQVQSATEMQREIDDDDDAESDVDEDVEEGSIEERVRNFRTALSKLDIIMDLLFHYYDSRLNNTPDKSTTPTKSPSSTSSFSQLVAHFQSHILPTYQTRHTQFLLFRFAQDSPAHITHLLRLWLNIITDKAASRASQVAAANYVASFVARGEYVDRSQVLFAFDHLTTIAMDLRRKHESQCGITQASMSLGKPYTIPDPQRFATYYATVQALLYIYCFRWRDFVINSSANSPTEFGYIDSDTDSEFAMRAGLLPSDPNSDLSGTSSPYSFAPGVKIGILNNLHSPLNPLRIINASVVDVFAKIAHGTQLCYVYSIIERNRRIRFSSNSQGGADVFRETNSDKKPNKDRQSNAVVERLDASFPFDPYRLPRSSRWTEGYYRTWDSSFDNDADSEADVAIDVSENMYLDHVNDVINSSDEEVDAESTHEDEDDNDMPTPQPEKESLTLPGMSLSQLEVLGNDVSPK